MQNASQSARLGGARFLKLMRIPDMLLVSPDRTERPARGEGVVYHRQHVAATQVIASTDEPVGVHRGLVRSAGFGAPAWELESRPDGHYGSGTYATAAF